MSLKKQSYHELIGKYCDESVRMTLENGDVIERRVEDIEDTSSGWPTPLFVVDPEYKGDGGILMSEIKSIELV